MSGEDLIYSLSQSRITWRSSYPQQNWLARNLQQARSRNNQIVRAVVEADLTLLHSERCRNKQIFRAVVEADLTLLHSERCRNIQIFRAVVEADLTLLHSEWPKLLRVLAVLSAIGITLHFCYKIYFTSSQN